MKKSLLMACCAIFVWCQTQAQLRLGVTSGLNYSNTIASIDGVEDPGDFRWGYHAGLFSSFSLNEELTINPELVYTNKGFQFDAEPGAIPEGDGALHFHYLNVPVLAGYDLTDRVKLILGPQFGYLIAARSKFEDETLDVDNIWDNKFEFTVAAGINYRVLEKLTAGVRYDHGLTSVIESNIIRDAQGNQLGTGVKYLNRAILFSIGYIIL